MAHTRITINDAKILWPNLSGATVKYNERGRRYFHLLLTEEQANKLTNDYGLNCRLHKAKNEDMEDYWTLQVFARFDKYPPKIYQISGNNYIQLTEETVGLLDGADIAHCDLTINPSFWKDETGGRTGYKAYVETMFVTLNVDPLMAQYGYLFENKGNEPADIPAPVADGDLPF